MKSASIPSANKAISKSLQQTRQNTLELLTQIDRSVFAKQAHSDFSPIGWHFGHIAFTEAYWILEYLGKSKPNFPKYQRLFAADGLPKQERENLPNISIIEEYLATIRAKTLAYLEVASMENEERLWQWLIQHESQHSETISFIWQLHQQQKKSTQDYPNIWDDLTTQKFDETIEIKEGEFIMGNNAVEAQDNERPAHKVYLNSYRIDRFPITCQQYYKFIAAGGYSKQKYWSKSGWQWLQENAIARPLYWSDKKEFAHHPVYGVSYYEAEAYANFAGKRLPTEAEWEKAALGASFRGNHSNTVGHTTPVNAYSETSYYGCQDMLGNVWEWTASWFDGYKGFENYPYASYSKVYFDGKHRVLRGGSWATNKQALRTSFRNWYHPEVRQILAGFRCVEDIYR